MKNLNLIKRLWTDSHEKQKVRSMRRYAVLLLLLFTFVTHTWATTLYIRGEMNNWADKNITMTGSSSPWTYTGYIRGEFKISAENWGNPNIGGDNSKLAISRDGTEAGPMNGTGGNNMYINGAPSDGGIYSITLTYKNSKYYISATPIVEEGSTEYDISNNTYIYFNVVNASSTYTAASILLGKSGGSQDYAMSASKITNTQLFYKKMGQWDDFKTFLFINANNWGGSWSSEKVTQRIGGATNTNTYNTNLSNSYYHMFTVASGDDNANLTYTKESTYGALLNKTQTVQVKVSENNGGSYSNAAFASWPGSINVARTYMSSATASSSPAATAMTAATTSAAITSSITFTGANTTEYTFAGWSNSPTGPDGNASKTYTVTGAATKYAFYKRKQYSVTFDAKGDKGSSTVTATAGGSAASSGSNYNHGVQVVYTANPDDGYEIEGWYSDASCTVSLNNGTNETYTVNSLTAASSAYVKFQEISGFVISYTAQSTGWTYGDKPSSAPAGDAVSFEVIPSTGYSVTVSTNDAVLSGPVSNVYSFTMPSSDVSITVAATANDYVVALARNGGDSDGDVTVTYNSSATKSFHAAAKTGYDCTGYWTQTSEGYRVVNTNGSLVSYNANVATYLNTNGTWKKTTATTLNAQWTAHQYTITINKNGGDTEASGTWGIYYDGSKISGGGTMPTKTGYHIEGYYADSECENKVAERNGTLVSGTVSGYVTSGVWKRASNTELYVKWAANTYTVTLKPNGGTGDDQVVTATYGAAMPSTLSGGSTPITIPTKDGYTFGGFYKENNGTGNQYYTNDLTSARNWDLTSATNLYAKWTQTVTLNANTDHHGSGDNTSATATYNGISSSLIGFSATSAATGYQLEGYYSDPTSGVKVLNSNGTYASDNVTGYITSGKWTKSGATTLYAHLTAKTYSITLNQNGSYQGNGNATATYMSNKLTISSAAKRTGFDVLGYYKEVGCTNLIADSEGNLEASTTYTDASGNWTSTSGQTLYAKWGMQVPATLTIDGQLTGGWDDRHSMAKDGRVYTYTVYDLPAGTYEFCFKTSGGSDYLKTNTSFCSSTKNAGNITWESSDDHDSENHHNFYITTGSTGFSDITITVTFGETKAVVKVDKTACSGSSSWYLIGDRYSTWDADKAKYRFNRSWRGMSGIYYRIENVDNNGKYFKLSTTSDRYGPSGSDQTVALNSKYTANKNTSESVGNKAYKGNVGWVWCVVDPRNGSNVQFWVENKTYYTLSTSSDHGTVTIKDNTYNLAATQYESGETVKISVSAADGYLIDDITIGGSSIATDVHATSYNGTTSMPASDATLTVTYVQSYTLNYSIGTVVGTDGTISSSPTTASGSLVIGGNTVTLTAPAEKTGYTWKGWYLNNDGSGIQQCETKAYAVTMNADKTLYACYTENMTTVNIEHNSHGHVEIGGATVTSTTVGVATTRTIKAVPDANYYFAGWVVPDGADFSVDDASAASDSNSKSTTLRGLGSGTEGTLTAKFEELNKVYFRNWNEETGEPLWDKVYVGFDAYWDNYNTPSHGAGVNGKQTAEMTQITGTHVYWAYVPRSVTYNNQKTIVFYDDDVMNNWDNFNGHNAAYREDYTANTGKHNMFVPYHEVSNTFNSNNTNYYSDKYHLTGYWMKYDIHASEEAGYYLKVYNSRNNYTQKGEYIATSDGATAIQFKHRVDNTSSDKTRFMIVSAGGINYLAGSTVTSVAYSDITLNIDTRDPASNDVYFQLNATSEGDYTFIIDQQKDYMRLTVVYPVSPGDYRLKHTYIGGKKKSDPSADSTYVTYSDIIKASDASSSNTVSMYLNDGGTETLMLQECERIDGTTKQPVWSAGDATNLSSVLTELGKSGNGVYQFDITINTSTDKVSNVDKIKLYDGQYYIKTDYAPGGWVNYTQNVLHQNTINFSKADATTFDYYHCAWIGDGQKNVKCVIANEYNQHLTDTLIGDDVLGIDASTGKPREYLAVEANVRYSYNSYTNGLKRAYINGASGWEDTFLMLYGDAKVRKSSSDASTNMTFSDDNNWIYQLDLQAQPNATYCLAANYKFNSTNHFQSFKGSINSATGAVETKVELIGNSSIAGWQDLRVIYDFKTNNLIIAWLPSGSVGTTINLYTDVLLIHNRKALADPGDEVSIINLTGSAELTHINKVYSAFRFQKTTAGGYVGLQETPANSAESYYRYNYWISFPYDVKMTDIFGIDSYGSKWRIQRHRGDLRAQNGWYKGDGVSSFWETIPLSDDEKLNKGEGYVLQLSPSAFQRTTTGSSFWDNSVTEIYLYFPSKAEFGDIEQATSSVALASWPCTKGAFTDGSGRSHNNTDSHWHVFGIPTFNDATGTTGTGTYLHDGADSGDEPESYSIDGQNFYFYVYNNDGTTYNTYTPRSSSGFTFQPMHAYMIQMAGTLNFTKNSVPASVAARRMAEGVNYDIQLNLMDNSTLADQTFVTLRENAVEDFALNEDLTKVHNTGKSNIYSYAGVYDVAANILPIENQTVSLGVETAANGLYTFSMPSEFSGSVVLIDTYTGARTNLALGDYEVNLTKGTLNDRFLLEINIHNAPTAIEGIEGGSLKDGKAHKFVQNGVMYILRDGKIYDARGAMVK